MLRDTWLAPGRWARFFGTLLNAKSDKLRFDIIEGKGRALPTVGLTGLTRGSVWLV